MPRHPTTRTCVTLKSNQVAALQHLHHETGIPVAEAVRRALDSFLADRVAGYVPGPLRPVPDTEESGLLVGPEVD